MLFVQQIMAKSENLSKDGFIVFRVRQENPHEPSVQYIKTIMLTLTNKI